MTKTIPNRLLPCTVVDCPNHVLAKGLCNTHYLRLRIHGTFDPPAIRRFWERVNKKGPNGCWCWTGHIRQDGYGSHGTALAHRFSYQLLVGPIPEGLQLDHLCRNPPCVNPDHLEPVTGRENVMRGMSIPARRARQTHCKRGHEFTVENTYVSDRGHRTCRKCHATREWLKRRGMKLI